MGLSSGPVDQHAVKRVRAFTPVRSDHHANGQRAARLAGLQRAQIVGDALRQHRYDAVGKVDRVAAQQRIAVESRSRPHVVGDIGNRDVKNITAVVVGIAVGFGMHRVVVVLGVRRIDGDERHVAPVLAALQGRGLGRFGLLDCRR
jgi:hypothetical protein